jgi:hypothetical protein
MNVHRFSSDLLIDKPVEATGFVFVTWRDGAPSSGSSVQRLAHYLYEFSNSENTVGYVRTNVIGPRTSFVIASVRSRIH